MQRHEFYLFNAGVNFKTNANAGVNELVSAENMVWEGEALYRRRGYGVRNAALDISSVYASGDVVAIRDQRRFKWGSDDLYLIFAEVDSGGGSTTDKLVVFYSSGGVPTSAATFTPLGSSYAITYASTDPFSCTQVKDKVYLGLGDPDPYVIYLDSGPKVKELPLCDVQNDGSTAGALIIANGSSDDWNGCQFVVGFDNYLYVGDGRTLYFALADAFGDPAQDIDSSAAATVIAGVQANWSTEQRIDINFDADLFAATGYKNYIFVYGKQCFYHIYNRDFFNNDIDKQRISEKGVLSNLLVTPRGIFWIAEDGLWGTNGVKTACLSKKVWDRVEAQHSNLPSDLEDCSLAYYQQKVWVSFPNGTDAEVYVFDPDKIYSDGDADYAPLFPFRYLQGSAAQAFTKLYVPPETEKLFAVNGKHIYQLDNGYFDDNLAGSGKVGISYHWQPAYWDFGTPSRKKTYGRTIIESLANIDGIAAITATFYRDHGEESSTTPSLDTTYTGNQRSYIELDTPYQVDGNTLSIRVSGDASGCSGSGAVVFYGVAVDDQPLVIAKAER